MPSEIIRFGDDREFLGLRLVERGTALSMDEGDLRLAVQVRYDNWAGDYDGVWVARDEWLSFVMQMRVLERDRRGKASLIAISPEEFELHIRITSPAGHVEARGFLSRYHSFRPGGPLRSRIEFECPIDPSMLRIIVGKFEEFTDPNVRFD